MSIIDLYQKLLALGVCFEPCGSTSSGVLSGVLEVRDEGVSVTTSAGVLNFTGSGVLAKEISSGLINIYIPPPVYSDNYNEGSAVVSNPTTTSRYISNPTGNFDIGDWSAGTAHSTLRTSPIEYTMSDTCSILNTSTIFTATIYGADGLTPLRQSSLTLNGNTVLTQNDITIQISNWATEYDQYVAEIDVSFDLDTILPSGGRFSIELKHNDGSDGTFTKTHNNIFYDKQENSSSLSGVTISETVGQVTTKFISGIEYYTNPSQFTVGVSDIDYLNDKSYPSTQVEIDGYTYTLSDLNLQGSDLTDWDSDWNSINNSYQKTDWSIEKDPERTVITTTAQVRARTKDWSDGSWVNSSSSGILIETHDDSSTRLTERFYDESWRCTSGTGDSDAKWDSDDAKSTDSWTSSSNVESDDAVFWDGGCGRNTTNWQSYGPNAASQPDYSSQDSTVYLWREFKHDGSASSGFTLNISGTYESLEYKLAKAWDGSTSGGTEWIDASADFNASEWNNGNPTGGSGGKTGTNTYTFGTNNIINTSDTMYIKIGFVDSQKITALSVVFD
ncbi:hypothetical protein GF373_17500 [bacterium]|nr:hypothetical protein [bacterium]